MNKYHMEKDAESKPVLRSRPDLIVFDLLQHFEKAISFLQPKQGIIVPVSLCWLI